MTSNQNNENYYIDDNSKSITVIGLFAVTGMFKLSDRHKLSSRDLIV